MKHTSTAALIAILAISIAGTAAGQSGTTGSDSSRNTTNRVGNSTSQSMQTPAQSMARTHTVIGSNVQNPEGKKVGEIKDLALNPSTGQVEYALVNVGGIFGVAGKHVAVPWKQLQAGADSRTYMLNIDADTLKAAPDVSANRWAETATDQWVATNDRFWSSAKSKTAAGSTGTSSGASSSGADSGSDSSASGKSK